MKRLRQEQLYYSKEKISYYAVGEYGSKTKRPHYHLLLFNVHKNIDYAKVWKLGISYPLPAKTGSYTYVLKYMSKQKEGNFILEQLPNGTTQKKIIKNREFSLMSKGIGKNYLTKNIIDYHQNLENCYLTLQNGHKQPLPKILQRKTLQRQSEKKSNRNYQR